MKLHRWNHKAKSLYTVDCKNIREAGREVAFCAHDNLGLDRSDSAEFGQGAEGILANGEEFELGHYTFRLEKK